MEEPTVLVLVGDKRVTILSVNFKCIKKGEL